MRSKADLHVHTIYSGVGRIGKMRFPESITKPEEIVEAARANNMRVLCVTDHNTTKGGVLAKKYAERYDDIEVVVGEEIMTSAGEIAGLWLTEEIPAGLSPEETVRRIREQGGIVIVPHPFSFHVHAINEVLFDIDADGIEVLNGLHVDAYSNRFASEVFKKYPGRWAEISSSDSHSLKTFGFAWTEFEGESAEDLRNSILNRTTKACGRPVPVGAAAVWMMTVVYKGFTLLLRSLAGRLRPDPDDPFIEITERVAGQKKLAGVVGAMIYLFPPIPFLASIATNVWMDRKAKKLLLTMQDRLDALPN